MIMIIVPFPWWACQKVANPKANRFKSPPPSISDEYNATLQRHDRIKVKQSRDDQFRLEESHFAWIYAISILGQPNSIRSEPLSSSSAAAAAAFQRANNDNDDTTPETTLAIIWSLAWKRKSLLVGGAGSRKSALFSERDSCHERQGGEARRRDELKWI